MIYKELVVYIDVSFREEFTAELLMLNFESFADSDNALHAYMPANRWHDSLLDEIHKRLLKHQKSGKIQLFRLDVREVTPQNWQEQWERTITPVYAGKKVVIRPSWHTVDLAVDTIDIVIDPKMSFGTGHHETTQMMVELLEEYCLPGMNVLDVGTGSGILAIIAAKMGAAYVAGIDNDPDAIADAHDNCKMNNVHKIVRLYSGTLKHTAHVIRRSFDLILANIERKVILDVFGDITDRLTNKGILLISGFLEEDYSHIEEARMHRKLSTLKTIRRTSQTTDTWIAIAIQK
jgi:ribosomal protein L11 methyltransferase